MSLVKLVNLKDLDQSLFHLLGNQLVKAIYPKSKCLQGSGGDSGIDCYYGNLNGKNLHVFQHKFLPNTLGNPGKAQIIRSLKKMLEKYPNTRYWTLLLPKNLTIGEQTWFDSTIVNKYKQLKAEVWDETYLCSLLFKHPEIRQEFFPLPSLIQNLFDKHFLDLKANIVLPATTILKSDIMGFPSIEQISKNSKICSMSKIQTVRIAPEFDEYEITDNLPLISNIDLCNDMFDNHYPNLKSKWNNLTNSIKKFREYEINFNNNVREKLVRLFETYEISYKVTMVCNFEPNIPLIKFVERFYNKIKSEEYLESDFEIDAGYPHMVNITYTKDANSLIYQAPSQEEAEKIVSILRLVCKSILKEMNNDIKNLKFHEQNCIIKANLLNKELGRVIDSPLLSFHPDRNGMPKCAYVNSPN